MTSKESDRLETDDGVASRLAELPDVLTLAEVCSVLRVSRRTYARWKRSTTEPLQPMRATGSYRFAKADLVRYLNDPHRGVFVPGRSRRR
jgi:hypothetical protein